MSVRDTIYEKFVAFGLLDEDDDPYELLIYVVQDDGSVWESIDPTFNDVKNREVLVVDDVTQYTLYFDGDGKNFEIL